MRSVACRAVSFLIVFLFAGSIAVAEFTDGLVLYLPLDEGSGDVAKDVSGNGHDGVIDNPSWVKGKFGSALEFGGEASGSFVTVESTDMLNVDQMTFMVWIKPVDWNGVRQIVGKSVHGGCGGRVQYGLFSEGGVLRLRFETEGGRSNIDSPLPDVDVWTHVTVTNDGSDGRIYLNGVESGVGPVAGKLKANEDPWRLAQDCERTNYIFNGIIDEARLWNRPLDENEIKDYMDKGVDVLSVEPNGKLATTWGVLKRLD